MTKNIKTKLSAIFLLSLVLLISCKDQEKELSLEEKIEVAVASRKIPGLSEQKVSFTSPDWLLGNGPHITEIFCHLESYLPTVLIEKGTTEIKKLPENLSN